MGSVLKQDTPGAEISAFTNPKLLKLTGVVRSKIKLDPVNVPPAPVPTLNPFKTPSISMPIVLLFKYEYSL